MYERVIFALRFSMALLVLSGYLALVSVWHYSVALLLIPVFLLLLMPACEMLDARLRAWRLLTRAAAVLFILLLPVMFLRWNLLDTVIVLVIFVQAINLFIEKSIRHYYYVFLMAFFLLLAACVQGPEPVIGLVLLLFLFSAIWAMLTLRLYAELAANRNGRMAEVIPAGSQAADRFRGNQNLFDWEFIFSVSLISLFALLTTGLVFVLTPRVEAGFLGRNNLAETRTGISPSVNLAGGGSIQEDPTPLMRVSFPEEPGGRYGGPLYWRITTFQDYYRSEWLRKWLRAPLTMEDTLQPPPRAHLSPNAQAAHEINRRRDPEKRLVRQVIYMDNVPASGMPCLDLAQRVQIPADMENARLFWDIARDFTVQLEMRPPRRLSWNAWSEIPEKPPAAIREENFDYRRFMNARDYGMLTDHQLQPETLALIEAAVAGAETTWEKAAAVETWLSSGVFEYSLNVPQLPETNPIDIFLRETRTGHCELFASAMALALRSQKIPARVVSGFRGGEWNPIDQSYIIRASMAHMWVEVWFPHHGFVIFDPSPRASEVETGGVARMTNIFTSYAIILKMFWYQEIIGFDRGLQAERLTGLLSSIFGGSCGQAAEEDGLPGKRGKESSPLRVTRLGLLAAVLVPGAAVILLFARRHRGGKRYTPLLSADQQRAIRLYRQLCRQLRKCGLECAGYTAIQIREQAAAADIMNMELLDGLLQTWQEARFGHRPLPQERYRTLKKDLRRLSEASRVQG
jgi:protein-glutamine gamma-glutamyltransferase